MITTTVYCINGFIVEGLMLDNYLSPFGGLKWIKIQNKHGTTIVNSQNIIAIKYGNQRNSRKQSTGNRTS